MLIIHVLIILRNNLSLYPVIVEGTILFKLHLLCVIITRGEYFIFWTILTEVKVVLLHFVCYSASVNP